MGFKLPNGATFEIASAYGADIPVTAITNAKPAVASATAPGLALGDVIAITSGWTKLNQRAVQVGAITSGTFVLAGIDTTKTQTYPAGSGVGSVREVTTWAAIPQITDVAASGGEQQFFTFGFLEDDDDRQIPTTKNPSTLALTVADDPSLAYVEVCEEADADKEPRVLRLNLPNGDSILYNGYVSITTTPALARNNLMTRVINVSLTGRPTRYSAA